MRDAILGTEASELVEFALVLPLLLLLAVGVADFSGAYILRNKLVNAAREGARSATSLDSLGNPPTVQEVCEIVRNSMASSGLLVTSSADPCPAAPGAYPCPGVSAVSPAPISPSSTYCFGSGGVTIEPQLAVSGTTPHLCSRVTVSYPYTWSVNSVVGLLGAGSSIALPSSFSSQAVMVNLF